MKCIDDLFDWILEEIFKRLPLQSRLICKEVCQRWLEILMTRAIFREDRHIYLSNPSGPNNIAPYTTITNSKFAYETLTIYDEFSASPEKKCLFWRHLGKSIKKVHYRRKDRLFDNFLTEMPLVEEIIFDQKFIHATVWMLESWARNISFLPNLRRIVFHNSYNNINETYIRYTFRDAVAKLRKAFSQDLQIKIENLSINEENIGDFDWIVENLASNELEVEVKNDPNHFSHKLLSLQKLPEKKMCLNFSNRPPSFEYLDSFLAKHPNIKSMKIHSGITPFPKPYTQITKIFLEISNNLTSFKVFENLENLEYLSIFSWGFEECIVGHENINLPKLKFLKMCDSLNCADCWKSIATSFPSMEEFNGKYHLPDSTDILVLMFKNWPKLETMDFKCSYSFNSSIIIDLEERPNLKVLVLPIEIKADFQILYKVFPNLRKYLVQKK